MKIENEIKQTKFKSEDEKLLINIIFTNNWIASNHKPFFDQAGITVQQFNILRILRGAHESVSTMQIRDRMLDKMSDTSRLVDRLVAKGFAKKMANKLDKRLVCVTIAPKGLALLKKMDDNDHEIIGILNTVTETEAKQLNKLLDKLRSAK